MGEIISNRKNRIEFERIETHISLYSTCNNIFERAKERQRQRERERERERVECRYQDGEIASSSLRAICKGLLNDDQ